MLVSAADRGWREGGREGGRKEGGRREGGGGERGTPALWKHTDSAMPLFDHRT